MIIRKMLSTKRMVLCLFTGFILAAAMFSTVPIYTDGALQRTLVKELQNYQTENEIYPGEYTVSQTITNYSAIPDIAAYADEIANSAYSRAENIGMPVLSEKTTLCDDYAFLKISDTEDGFRSEKISIMAGKDFGEHINIIEGSIYSDTVSDGVYEMVASRTVAQSLNIFCGMEFTVSNAFNTALEPIKVRLVGIYEPKDDAYLSATDDEYNSAFYVDYDTFINDIIKTKTVTLKKLTVKCELDYQRVDVNKLDSIVSSLASDSDYYAKSRLNFSFPAKSILEDYKAKAGDLRYILWMLEMPVMLMIAFYMFMASSLNASQESNEIAVLKSRGASRLQIMCIYAIEAGILAVAAIIIAPIISLLFCKVLGVSNGFLEFVNRKALPVRLTSSAFKYAFLAASVFFVTAMLPIIPATKTTIVGHKQKKNGKRKIPLWEKGFFDFILIALSVYWLISYNLKQKKLTEQGADFATASMDPLIFVASAFFILGCGLLFIRIYPLILKLVYNAGRRLWTPSQYAALTSVSRGGGREGCIMVFLVLTVGLGIFSANSARAVNTNIEERIYYANGADVTMKEYWRGVYASEDDENSELQYEEPEFERFYSLSGVEKATKVLEIENAAVDANGGTQAGVNILGIIPDEFGEVARFKSSLLPVHWYHYLNALTDCKSGALISSDMAEEKKIKAGDTISIKWDSNDAFEVNVLAVIDYWPSLNPHKGGFAVINYEYASLMTPVTPYSVWIKMQENAKSADLYASIEKTGLNLTELSDSAQQVIKAKNAPELQGMNGAMTMGFIIIMLTTVIGFLIYWVIEIKSRTLQFGIFRAMGMSARELTTMLLYEQLLVSLMSVVIAVVIGGAASDLFVPLFSSMYSISEQVPPLTAVAYRGDYIKIYIIVFLMFLVGFAVLGNIVRRIKINQALKLGED